MFPAALNFELVSPEKLWLAGRYSMIVLPAAEGYMGILPGHAPLVTGLGVGVLEVYAGETVDQRIFITGGFAEVDGERCTVLAEEVWDMIELNPEALADEIAKLEEEVTRPLNEAEAAASGKKLAVAKAKQAALQHLKAA